jgi:hypothetical protein
MAIFLQFLAVAMANVRLVSFDLLFQSAAINRQESFSKIIYLAVIHCWIDWVTQRLPIPARPVAN